MNTLERRQSIENIRSFNKSEISSDKDSFFYLCQREHRNEVIGLFYRLGYTVVEFERVGRVHNVVMQVFRDK